MTLYKSRSCVGKVDIDSIRGVSLVQPGGQSLDGELFQPSAESSDVS